ncbi:MAG TPA: hypothetical protein DCP02_03495 [Actinobacteria bacterium]|nr:hypothetical protein [Actinomycetota bacterium]
MNKDKKFLIVLVSAVILLFCVSMLFSGCSRRARIAEALRDKESENVEEENIDESADTEEIIEEEDIDEDEEAGTEDDAAVEEDVNEGGSDVDAEEEITDDGVVDDDEEEVEQPGEPEQFTADIPLVVSECGNVIDDTAHFDPVIYPGDSGEQDLEVRGFISFDISGLAGATVMESKISATADAVFGKPFVTYGPLIVKAVYWGLGAFSPADRDLDGVELGNYSKKNFGIQNRNLKEDLQRAIDSGGGRYQLIFYFEMNETDGDSQADNITYYLEDISLNITYTQ